MTKELKERFEEIADKHHFKNRPVIIAMLEEAYALDRKDWIHVSHKHILPEYQLAVLGALQHWNTKNYRYAEIKRVKESDCDWRTVDDNSEISYDWTVTHWMPLPKNPSQL